MLTIFIVGATGEVGRTILKVLEERLELPCKLKVFSGEKSHGKYLMFKNQKLKVEKLDAKHLKEKADYVLFSAGAEVSKRYALIAGNSGSVVIDNSSAFRMEKSIPLIIPEINGWLLKNYKGIIANPNCSTIQMLLALYKIHKVYEIEEIVVSTYQSVSGAGRSGINELLNQIRGHSEIQHFPETIFQNVIPQIGNISENGFSKEEIKMIKETHKILNNENIKIYPTTVRVPVLYGHSEAIFVRVKKTINNTNIKSFFTAPPYLEYIDNLLTPKFCSGKDTTFVSRLRICGKREFLIWVVADNVRVGAATNAVKILLLHYKLNKSLNQR